MIPLSKIKSQLSIKRKHYNSSNFFNIHRCFEAYLKRLLLIGLRLNSVKYQEANVIVESTYVSNNALIDKVLCLLDTKALSDADKIARLKATYCDFFVIKEVFISFSCKYRNRLAHGSVWKINEGELVDTLCFVDLNFYSEFERLLFNEHGHSAFETSTAWGAKFGITETIEVSAKRLRLGKILDKPLSIEVVKQRLNLTKISS